MYYVHPEGAEYQSVTYPIGESLGRDIHVRHHKRIRKSPQRYDPWFGDARECNNDAVKITVYMIQDRYLNRSVDTYDIPLLLAEWDSEDCMDARFI